MIANGVMLFLTHSDMVKMAPPLNIPDDALREGLEVLGESVAAVISDQRAVGSDQ